MAAQPPSSSQNRPGNQPGKQHNAHDNDLLRIIETRRSTQAQTSRPTPQQQQPAPKPRATELTHAQQKRNTIIAMTLIPAAIFGAETAAASTVYNDLAKPMMTAQGSCARATERFAAQRDATLHLLLGTSVDEARQGAELHDDDTLNADETTPATWVRLGDSAPAVQTLLTTTLLMQQPETLPKGASRKGTTSITAVVAPPDDDEDQVLADTATAATGPTHHLDPVDYAGYVEGFPRAHDALATLTANVIDTINGTHEDIFTPPACASEDDVRAVVRATDRVMALERSTQSSIDALAARLRFAEVDTWCTSNDDAKHTRAVADEALQKAAALQHTIEEDDVRTHADTAALDEHSKDIERIAENLQQQKQGITDHPTCTPPGGSPTDLEAQHAVIAEYHDDLDAKYGSIMAASIAINRHAQEVDTITEGAKAQAHQEEAQRQEQVQRREEEARRKQAQHRKTEEQRRKNIARQQTSFATATSQQQPDSAQTDTTTPTQTSQTNTQPEARLSQQRSAHITDTTMTQQ